MSEDEIEKKHILLNKIASLVKVASAMGEALDDEQTQFIAETFKLVMIAGSDPETSILFGNHVINYLEELDMIKGKVNAKDHLIQNLKIEAN